MQPLLDAAEPTGGLLERDVNATGKKSSYVICDDP